MYISWRRPSRDAGTCLPCAACTTCLCLMSIPPTLCVGMLLAVAKELWQARLAKWVARCAAAAAAPPAEKLRPLCFRAQRRLWLQVLASFFRHRSELRDLGPLVWQFLDDQPEALRLATRGGRVFDTPLGSRPTVRRRSALPEHVELEGEVLALLPGRAVHALPGGFVAVTDLGVRAGGGQSELLLEGHLERATCFSQAGDCWATGSVDTTVRLWRDSECVRVCASQEWSEWTGTLYLGHVSPVTAVCAAETFPIASGDEHGAVCVWRRDGICQMLQPAHASPVTCLAVHGPDSANNFAVGHQDGSLLVASWLTAQVLLRWSCGERVLAALPISRGDVLAVCPGSMLRASPRSGIAKLGALPLRALCARFDGDLLIVCGQGSVAILSLDGHTRAVVAEADVCAAVILRRGPVAYDDVEG